ncbi:hypothetical protein QA612_04315 [Evansella sp. AB-P1]|uniref:hypothetical protein n=1 Tax=Evansella sp. AB-P1 TaxID=3037653 RepID=UPI00241CED50|nr:hypothetical protein [Evansella sp. AB-P1]MDG5786705.1 hypothetical protein [Evansella sp. AB-P1]
MVGLKLFQNKKTKCSTHICCPSCGDESTVEEWNEIAVSIYGKSSPDVRTAALDKKISFPFQCPNCYRGFSAYLLEFVDKK